MNLNSHAPIVIVIECDYGGQPKFIMKCFRWRWLKIFGWIVDYKII